MKQKSYFRNCVSLAGYVIASGFLFAFIIMLLSGLLHEQPNPWFGFYTYVVVPSIFFCGVGMIFAGAVLKYILERFDFEALKPGVCPCHCFKCSDYNLTADFTKASTWKSLIAIVLVLGVSGAVAALAGLGVYHWTEEDIFCGALCHAPMEPEYAAHKVSSHANVACVDCHVGSGLDAYAVAKINGIVQLYSTLSGSYKTKAPITPHGAPMHMKHLSGKTKVEVTCQGCHWEQKYVGNKEKTFTHFLKNEEDAKVSYLMSFNVGGGDPEQGPVGGFHSHVAKGTKIQFVTDSNKRDGEINWVRMCSEAGVTNIFARDGFELDLTKQKVFTMSCYDCHNRPAHKNLSPVTAVDNAIASGALSLELGDNVKYVIIDILTNPYESQAEALKGISETMTENFEGAEGLEAAIKVVQNIYKQNIFPEMKADWKNFAENIGHKESEGCARCHNPSMLDAKGETAIRNGCQDCHTIKAQFKADEWDEASSEGLEFKHPDGNEQSDISSCSSCHDGTY